MKGDLTILQLNKPGKIDGYSKGAQGLSVLPF